MAIFIYCDQCRTSSKLDAKECKKCGAAFGRDKRYRVSAKVKGQTVAKLCNNLTIARETEATLKADMVRGTLGIKKKEKPTITLNELWEKHFLPWAKEHKKTWKIDQYNYGKHLRPRFGSKKLDSISPIDVERMKKEMRQETNQHGRCFTKASIKHEIVLLRRIYNLAKRWNLYKGENPTDRVEIPKLDNQVTEFLSDDEMQRLNDVLDSWPCRETVAFVRLAMLTGVRRGELFKLTWADIDFDRCLITLREPKGGKTETIPVSADALASLQGLDRGSSDYVFPGRNGGQRTDFKGPWIRIRKAADLPDNFRFHGLRHNFASHLVSNGVDLYTVGKLLTHKQTSTTARYAHLSDKRVRDAAELSGDLLKPKQSKVIQLVKK
ncbi:MAG: site-specific integrase [Deltaproteobacteria bacterium]|nr:site-specific integrase [Deltaproteobacteria bacterium]